MRIGDWSSDVCSSDLANLIPDFSPKPTAAHRPDDRRIANGALGPHQSKGQHIARRQGANAVQKSGQPPASQAADLRSEEHTSELQSLMRISYAVFCLTKKYTTPPS